MRFLRALVVVLALFEAGWMTYDGSRALIVGDYVTPREGPHAGQLGPWKHVVSAVGIEPRSPGMKAFFVAYGIIWLIVIVAFIKRVSWASTGMLMAAVASLWYLPIGTVCSAVQITGLIWLRRTS